MFPVIPGKLYRSARPGYDGDVKSLVSMGRVQEWIDTAQSLGIASIICILDEEHLCLYPDSNLLGIYRAAGFQVQHISAKDHSLPPLTQSQLSQVLSAYRALPKPVLIHCSAGLGRTGVAWAHIVDHEA
jgi:protein-tyrosine phosphatase